jgi:Cft2 family RNA processing exonuclease|tara:strand:+ start:5665 stop:6063 length:399 start_codon:yes stop_codon:yes gene_type:complete
MATVEEVIGAYMKLRLKKEAIEAAAKAEAKVYKEKMTKLEAWLKVKADEDGVTSFKTDSGTAFLTTTDFAAVADWDSVLNFIRDNDAYDMLEKRVSKMAVRGYIEANKSVPAGVNYGTKLDINIRKPVLKGE